MVPLLPHPYPTFFSLSPLLLSSSRSSITLFQILCHFTNVNCPLFTIFFWCLPYFFPNHYLMIAFAELLCYLFTLFIVSSASLLKFSYYSSLSSVLLSSAPVLLFLKDLHCCHHYVINYPFTLLLMTHLSLSLSPCLFLSFPSVFETLGSLDVHCNFS